MLELQLDADGPPVAHKLGPKNALPIASTGFDDDHLVPGASLYEAGPRDVVGR
jgi:hypothetical protein